MRGIRGRFITVEGQDGAGKTTNISYIHKLLSDAGHDVVLSREPGGTRLGEELRALVLDRQDLDMDPMAELLLIFAARAQHLSEVVVPALGQGRWVLCDRFTDATYAYQGGGRGLPEHHVRRLETMVQGELRPDLTLLLDVDPATGESRTERRSGSADRFESEQSVFKRAVRDAYLKRARAEPERIKIVDAGCKLPDVQREIETIIMRFTHSEP